MLVYAELVDFTVDGKEVYWPRWLYYGALEGTNGWETVLQVCSTKILG